MPAAHRGTAAHARVDRELAEWLTAQGHPCMPSRVAGWRAAGLLPAPTGTAARAGEQPGRAPVAWTDAELTDTRRIALRLVTSTGRGSSTAATALRLAGEGLPIPPTTVLAAARAQMSQLDQGLRAELLLPDDAALDPVGDPDGITDRVDSYVRTRPALQRSVERRLRGVPLDPEGADAQSVVTLLAAAALGLAPDPGDTGALDLTLRVFGVHGLVEPVGGTAGPRALPDGPAGVADALELFSFSRLQQLLDEICPEDVHPILAATADVGGAFAAVPAEGAHHLGSDVFAQILSGSTPLAVLVRLICGQALRRSAAGRTGIDRTLDAIRAQGWLAELD